MPKSTMPRTRMKDKSAIDEMTRVYGAALPRELGGAVNLFIHPIAGAAAMSAIGLGVASHAFGLWMGAMAGAAEASRRIMEQASEPGAEAAARPKRGSRPRLELVSSGVAPEAAAAMRSVAADAERVVAEIARTAHDIAEEANAEGARATDVALDMAQAAAEPAGPAKPRGMDRLENVDDLKAISGIGPKLEQVLNGLGIWSYAQIADFSDREIAWLDEELGFSGRIGRDDWTGQARRLAGKE